MLTINPARLARLLKAAEPPQQLELFRAAFPESTAEPMIRIGLPYGAEGRLMEEARALGGKILLSAGSMRRKSKAEGGGRYFTAMPRAAWSTDAALDSAGFVAAMRGGYDWSVEDYVDWVVTNAGDGTMPFPWTWWSAMDLCVENEVAADRPLVQARLEQTVDNYERTLEALDYWKHEGDTDTPDPLPIIQGRRPEDYVWSLEQLAAVNRRHGRRAFPAIMGVGSVCRRDLHGDEGLIPVLDALHAALPPHTKLHLFGVKGDALPLVMERYPGRVASIDSMAWDFQDRMETPKGTKRTVERRAKTMRRWHDRQTAKVREAAGPVRVKGHTRRLKDGRVVQVKGHGRQRRRS